MQTVPPKVTSAIAELTKKYRGERSILDFADLIGANSKQAVNRWEKALNAPDPGFLLQVYLSNPDEAARLWAGECLVARGLPLPPRPEPETEPEPAIAADPSHQPS